MYSTISTALGSRCWSDGVPGQLESQRCSWMVHLQLSHQLKGRRSNHGDERNHHTHLERGRTWKSLTWSVYSKIPPCNPCKCIKNDFVGFLWMLAHHCGTFARGEENKKTNLNFNWFPPAWIYVWPMKSFIQTEPYLQYCRTNKGMTISTAKSRTIYGLRLL